MRSLWELGAQRWGSMESYKAEMAKFRAPSFLATLQCFLWEEPRLEHKLKREKDSIKWVPWLCRRVMMKKTPEKDDLVRQNTEIQVYQSLEVDPAFFQCTRTDRCVDQLREKRQRHCAILRSEGQAAADSFLRTTLRAHRGRCRRVLQPGDRVRAPFIYGPNDWKVEIGTVASIYTRGKATLARVEYANEQTADLDLSGWWSLVSYS